MMPRLALPMLLLAGAVAVAAEPPPLGRVFFAPAERQALDAARDGSVTTAAAAGSGTVTVDGVVRRSTGADVVWVNGSAGADAVRSAPDRRATVVVEAAGRRVRLKPGQAFDPATGRVRDCVGCRRPPPPASEPDNAGTAGNEPASGAAGGTASDPAPTAASPGPATVAAGSP